MLKESDFRMTHTQQKSSQASSFPIKVALLTDMNLIVRSKIIKTKVVTQNKYCYRTELSVEILYKVIKIFIGYTSSMSTCEKYLPVIQNESRIDKVE